MQLESWRKASMLDRVTSRSKIAGISLFFRVPKSAVVL